jgi:enoyl-CoA hydratase/carnithine racemase
MSGDEAVRSGLFSRAVPGRARGGDAGCRGGRGIRGHRGVRGEQAARRACATSGSDSGTPSRRRRAQTALRDTADYREGFAAFQQKRPPVFRGR